MTAKRKNLKPDTRELIMIEAGYRCAVPTCRALTPLDVHHIVELKDGGSNEASNLICLCCNCHIRYHREKIISQQAIRIYKLRLQELSRAVDREAIDLLFYLHRHEHGLRLSGDKIVDLCALFNAGYLAAQLRKDTGQVIVMGNPYPSYYHVTLTESGREFVSAWEAGEPGLTE